MFPLALIRLRGGPGHLSGSRCLGGKAGLAAGTAQRRLAGTQGPGMDGRMGYHAGPLFGEKRMEKLYIWTKQKNQESLDNGCPNFVGFERFDPQQIPILMEKTRL